MSPLTIVRLRLDGIIIGYAGKMQGAVHLLHGMRQMLVREQKLDMAISLPSGTFKFIACNAEDIVMSGKFR